MRYDSGERNFFQQHHPFQYHHHISRPADLSTGKLSSFAAPLEPGVTTVAPLVRRVAATLRNSWSAVQRWVHRGAVDEDAEVV